ncbi:hypothetical protein AWB85_20075 [Mycobacteroides immunogenum]|uniref:TIR domain-containing protein n=1 Tax=Mycobacteroides immunogenum TaxID=83262 RepID=A0A179VCS8_9MYCO|nr:toll/interleukin-1 receptor domain-containing protein [Mycobacteroides immunogenum]OAT69689.1 hypothetical protein AWB85_20075 [Mycobacteroides immunogenum]
MTTDDEFERMQLSRSEVEDELARAKTEERVPRITGHATGVNLSGINFSSGYENESGHRGEYLGFDLRHANLRESNLEACDFAGANLRGADMTGANLRGANFYNALFQAAYLDYADASEGNFVAAEFNETSMRESVFRNARFGSGSFIATDLSSAIDLITALHRGPSAIDTSSLQLTCSGLEGQPEYVVDDMFKFLSATGLHDDLSAVVRTWVGQPIEYYSVFISHSSLDKTFARKLYRDLQGLGVKCWMDEKNILPGDSILDSIDQGIKVHDRVILVCSQNSLGRKTGWWVDEEIERALAKERELRRAGEKFGVLVPVTIDNYVFDGWNSGFQATVLQKNVGDFKNHQDVQSYAETLDKLAQALNRRRDI